MSEKTTHFGFSEVPEEEKAARVGEVADGAIVGTRLVREAREAHEGAGDPVPAVLELVRTFSGALA